MTFSTSSMPRFASLNTLLPFVVLALAVLAIWPTAGLVDDVSWLITVCERLLQGEKLYVDVIEANPPASVWLYLPAVALASAIHVAPETVINLQMWALLVLSLGLSAKILQKAQLLQDLNQPLLLALSIGILMLLPNGMFGQREHILLLCLLPLLSTLCLRMEGGNPSILQAVLAGLLAGVALSIKAHYVFAILAVLVLILLRHRNWRVIFAQVIFALEFWIMGLVLLAYLVAIYVFAPQFLHQILPVLADVYLPIRRSFADLTLSIAIGTYVAALLLVALALRKQTVSAPVMVLLAASFGAVFPFFIQGKNWPNHAFPMLRLALLTLAFIAADNKIKPDWRRWAAIVEILILWQPTSNWLKDVTGAGELRAQIAQLQPRPKLLYIGHILRFAHPVVRQLQGTYLSRVCYQWITIGAEQRKAEMNPDAATLARLEADIDLDRQWLIDDIKAKQPEIVLVQIQGFDWSEWIAASPELSVLLQPYQDRGTFNGVRILQKPKA